MTLLCAGRKGTLGGTLAWEFEVGEPLERPSADADGAGPGLMAASVNPVCVRKDTKSGFQWRIRNLPYALEVYSLTVNDDNNEMILRTSNKKYYKKFRIPDMERAGVPLDAEAASMAHANNTLIISYRKPKEVIALEKQLKAVRDQMKAAEDGDVDCTTQ